MMQITDNSERRNDTEMVADVEISSKIYREMQSPRALPSPMLVDASKIIDKSKGKLPSTPQKRQPRQPQVETPTKRRRISLEKDELPNAGTAIVAPAPLEEHVTDKDMDIELESLYSSLDGFVIKKKHLIIDKKIVKTNAVLMKWHENINFGCVKMEKPNVRVISSVDLMKRPSHSPRCAQALLNLFVNHTRRPCQNTHEDAAPIFMQCTRQIHIQILRRQTFSLKHDITNKCVSSLSAREEIRELQTTEDRTGLMTSRLVEPEEHSSEQLSTVMPVQAPWVIDEPLHREMKADVEDTNSSLEDINVLMNKMEIHPTTKDRISLSSCSTEKSQYAYLTSREVLTLLEVLWCNQPYVKFKDFIPKDTHSKQNAYTKQDAATVFCILLDLHAQKKVILHQTEFYHTLWIQKYEEYSD
ncbi:PREDICTED: uncharacterized protein LOC106745143 [Dinoponera quadriceps]|uniref:Uncharacterized protein LOC106745143 n=1 Tax=Dinoponera quadriceps TaxID=609295 RepID=A0A6P3XC43_DINQU|nr:PREDICTED: uncharacterized protein LOC106745143 [Dinoponera quadriceps]